MSLKPPLPPNTLLDYRHVYDEGSQQTAEDGINFTGAGVTVSDDPTNHRLNVTIPGASVAAGGEPYTPVDSLSATPRSVTDWGTLLNTAIAAGTYRFLFGPFNYPFTTAITANNVRGVHFEGASAFMGGDGQAGRTSLTWGGTGAGTAINASSGSPGYGGGGYFTHIIFLYSQTGTYTGRYFDFGNAFFAKFEHCDFSTTGDVSGSAASAIDAHSMNTLILSECNFGAGFSTAVRGRDPADGGGFSNVLRADECTFERRAIENPGLDYLLTHCVFELNALTANQSVIYDTAAYTVQKHVNLTLRDCAYWDTGASAASNRIVYNQYNWWNFAAYDCQDHTTSKVLAALYTLASGGGGDTASVIIKGGQTNNDIDVGDAATALKYVVSVSDVIFSFSSSVLNHNTGHRNVNLMNNDGLAGHDGRLRVSHEIANMADLATVAVAGGATGISVADSYAGDLSGVVLLSNGTGSPSSTGNVATVTLAHAPVVNFLSHYTALCVSLTPHGQPIGAQSSAANCYTCQVYATTSASDLTKFTIGINVALPAGQSLSVAYRVTGLESR